MLSDSGASSEQRSKKDDSKQIEKLQNLCYRLGEQSNRSVEQNIQKVAEIASNYQLDDAEIRSEILTTLINCAVYSKERRCLYSTLIGLLNIHSEDFIAEFVQELGTVLKISLKQLNHQVTMNTICFMADLVNTNVIDGTSLLDVYNNFLASALEVNTPQKRSDFYMECILRSIIWCGRVLQKTKLFDFKELFAQIDRYMKNRSTDHLKLLSMWISDKPNDELSLLYRRILNLQQGIRDYNKKTKRVKEPSNEDEDSDSSSDEDEEEDEDEEDDSQWINSIINKPYENLMEKFGKVKCHKLNEILPPKVSVLVGKILEEINMDIDENSENVKMEDLSDSNIRKYISKFFPYQKIHFTIYEQNDLVGKVFYPELEHPDRLFVENHINDVIDSYNLDREACVSQLLQLKFGGANEFASYYSLILEVIFQQMFTMPHLPYNFIFYSSLLVDLCNEKHLEFPPFLGKITDLIFEKLNYFNFICVNRFALWFSHHLSNFQYKWNWNEWADVLAAEDVNSPQILFLKETINRCIRLSYYNNIRTFLPEEYYEILPEEPTPIDDFYDENQELRQHSVVEYNMEISDSLDEYPNKKEELDKSMEENVQKKKSKIPSAHRAVYNSTVLAIKNKKSVLQILGEINKLSSFVKNVNEIELGEVKIKIFGTIMFHLGSRSLSHAYSAINKYRMCFVDLIGEDENKQIQLLNVLFGVWRYHNQMVMILVERLVKYKIVDENAVILWIFSEAMEDELTKNWIWEILFQTISRSWKKVKMNRQKYVELREKYLEENVEGIKREMKEDQEMDGAIEDKEISDSMQDQKEIIRTELINERINYDGGLITFEKLFVITIDQFQRMLSIKLMGNSNMKYLPSNIRYYIEHYRQFLLEFTEPILMSNEKVNGLLTAYVNDKNLEALSQIQKDFVLLNH
ncbi:hypothetical protein SNEBB_000680 [Seison nebaliae]|nr:hypothetical protein SNEBB_000680 [Seison nebaliae]